ncbi:HAD-IA family hydrolase [Rhodococcus sp. IEGM 1379]|uniref:HAD family hydrolase n=1 Tax=Rhodococcus sp. IEGM 1379 TaxID=3047086 RepID=UPI0024B6938E|nr:HAD-IA family hydrolase [Rhodococcus sp. IEGM 1379]MDI9915209.1 HAD-IA family hydrolase [Rhodococcus sp. IEGM 1379]
MSIDSTGHQYGQITATLFDFSGTLFRLEENSDWDEHFVDHAGEPMDVHAQAELMRRMTAPVGLTVDMDEAGLHAWNNRDRDPKLHRQAYLDVLAKSGVPDHARAEALYSLLIDPARWVPYPDAGEVLKSLSEKGIRTAVLSNIAFDIRPAFVARGWDIWVDEFVLSFEIGAVKPEVEIFEYALSQLDVDAERALMVGDSEIADGAARELGCAFVLVDPLPTAERPRALLDAVAKFGLL